MEPATDRYIHEASRPCRAAVAPRTHRHRRKRLVRHLMTDEFPRAVADDLAGDVRRTLAGRRYQEAGHVYLVDLDGRLAGQVPIEHVLAASPDTRLDRIQGPKPVEVHADDPAEVAAHVAVARHESDVAVVDEAGRLVGVVATPKLLALLHAEHVEDYLRAAGVGSSHPPPHEKYRVWKAYRARFRWLVVGLIGGIGAGFVVRIFERTLLDQIALAAFMPLVVYLADAIGTQTEAIVIRSFATGRERFGSQLLQEGVIGVLLGLSLGLLGLLTLFMFGIPQPVPLVVGVSILTASLVATLLSTLVCWGSASVGTDPAFASGPLATVIQDVISVGTYLFVATLLL